MAYSYDTLEERGYKRVSISKKDHKRLFKYRKIAWHSQYEYYMTDDGCYEMYTFINRPGVIVMALLLPIILLVEGLGDYKSVWNTHCKYMNQKKSGMYSGDHCYSRESTIYKQISKVAVDYKPTLIHKIFHIK